MGKLIDGRWHDVDYAHKDGAFVRGNSKFRDAVSSDGSTPYPAAAGRYHLYVSLACPWAHRTLVMRALKGLEDAVSVSGVGPLMAERGWVFSDGYVDDLFGAEYLHEIYTRAKPDCTGRVTVPILWDKETGAIVNNESSEIIRMLNSAFDAFTDVKTDYYPAQLRETIDTVNARVYDTVNNGVYKAGFARTQHAYDAAIVPLFETLSWLEEMLESQPYLAGDTLTEADWRLWTTLIRFDPVYHVHFKCSLRRLVDYPKLWALTQRLYAMPGIAETVDIDYIKRHYFQSHTTVNPHAIVPMGPAIDVTTASA
ncbi:MAG: putative glutathione S-transferase [Myxococcota bacterium]|jgi:putative glutathione S-transferase